MRRFAFWTSVTCVFICCLGISLSLHAQGRVSGLKISNSSVVGTTLSFDVTLSTNSSAGSPHIGFLGNHYHSSSSTTSTSTYTYTSTTTNTFTYPCSTTTFTTHNTCIGPSSSIYPCSTNTFTSHNTCTSTNTYPYTWTYTYFYTTDYVYGKTLLNPGLPAIDWGDGNTVSRTELPLVSSGPPKVYRRSFSHTYASTGGYQVRVGAFNQDIDTSLPGGGNIVTVNAPDTFKYFTYTSTLYKSSGSTMSSTGFSNTRTFASPNHSQIGVTTTASFGVPVELQSFTVADAAESMAPTHGPKPLEAGGLALGLALAAMGFVLLRRE